MMLSSSGEQVRCKLPTPFSSKLLYNSQSFSFLINKLTHCI
jgi:hypothetical protein